MKENINLALLNYLLMASNRSLTTMFAVFSVWLVPMLRPLVGGQSLRWGCIILNWVALHWGLLIRTQSVEQTPPSSQRFGRPHPYSCCDPNDKGHEKSQQEYPQTWSRLVTRHWRNHEPFVPRPILVEEACNYTGCGYCVQNSKHTQANSYHLEFISFAIASSGSCGDFDRSRTATKERQKTHQKQRGAKNQVQELRSQHKHEQRLGILIPHVARTCNRNNWSLV
jgi:hypothetical protein